MIIGRYNTVQEVTYFKQEGITLQPDLVMLTYVQNDIEVNCVFRPKPATDSDASRPPVPTERGH